MAFGTSGGIALVGLRATFWKDNSTLAPSVETNELSNLEQKKCIHFWGFEGSTAALHFVTDASMTRHPPMQSV